MTNEEAESIWNGGEGHVGGESDRPALPPLPRVSGPTHDAADVATRGFAAFAGFNRSAHVGLVAMASGPPSTRRRFAQTAYETLRSLAS